MPKTLSREGETGAVNTNTEITTDYDRTAPGAALPLGGQIAELLYALGITTDATGDQGVVGAELGGDGMVDPPVQSRYPIGGAGAAGTAASLILGSQGRFVVGKPTNVGTGGIRFGVLVAGDDVAVATEHLVLVFA